MDVRIEPNEMVLTNTGVLTLPVRFYVDGKKVHGWNLAFSPSDFIAVYEKAVGKKLSATTSELGAWIVSTGKDVKDNLHQLEMFIIPNLVFLGSHHNSECEQGALAKLADASKAA